MRVVIRAFNQEGYHKDIWIGNQDQTLISDHRTRETLLCFGSGLVGVGCGIEICDFPEMVRFEVVIQDKP